MFGFFRPKATSQNAMGEGSKTKQSHMGTGEVDNRVLMGKTDGNRPLGRPRRRWEDNIQMDLQEVGCGGMDWIELAQDRDRW